MAQENEIQPTPADATAANTENHNGEQAAEQISSEPAAAKQANAEQTVTEHPPVKSGPKYPVWVDVLAILGAFFAADFIAYLVKMLLDSHGGIDPGLQTFFIYIAKLVPVIAFALWLRIRRKPGKPLLRMSLRKADPALVLWGVVLVFITSYLVEPLLDMFPPEYLELLYKTVNTGGWAAVTTIIAAPVLEEILFRGIIQETVAKEYGVFRAVFISALVFGVVHIIPQQVVNAFFIGIILGYIYFRTSSLIPVIIIHALNNAFSYVSMLILEDKVMLTSRELINNDTIYWSIYAVCGVLFAIAIYFLLKHLRRADKASALETAKNNV